MEFQGQSQASVSKRKDGEDVMGIWKPTRVYRIQDKEGRGPWNPWFSGDWTDQELRPGMEKLVPFTAEDHSQKMYPGYYAGCGCLSLQDLRKWVSTGEYVRLQAMGYRSVMLEVDRIAARKPHQVLFERRRKLTTGIKKVRLYSSTGARNE